LIRKRIWRCKVLPPGDGNITGSSNRNIVKVESRSGATLRIRALSNCLVLRNRGFNSDETTAWQLVTFRWSSGTLERCARAKIGITCSPSDEHVSHDYGSATSP